MDIGLIYQGGADNQRSGKHVSRKCRWKWRKERRDEYTNQEAK